ncbi:MAG: DUF1501 domain-containing protein [Gemmataceae bacterium]
MSSSLQHPTCTRRQAIQAGAIGLLGLGSGDLFALQAASGARPRARSCIYIFLSGGLGQHDSFDLKPLAPDNIRGEFRPIATRTPGIQIVEHLPLLAERSAKWALVRSLTHNTNDHSAGHLYMLTGRSSLPPGFSPINPGPNDWPSIAAIAGVATRARNNLPPAVVLPEKIVHNSGRVIPGQFGGIMGRQRDPWFIEASPFEPRAYGAFPEYEFDHQDRPLPKKTRVWKLPSLDLPHEVGRQRFDDRLTLLRHVDAQRRYLDQLGEAGQFGRHHQHAVSLLTQRGIRSAFDVTSAPAKTLDRYGRNAFGYSLLMARRLVEAGVNLVQVNLGNNETWDTHGNAFPHLKNNLFPPTDRALSALLDDLEASGQLDSTLIVMAGEFGRTPRISTLPQFYKQAGRDHWGAVQTVWFAGGGVRGGSVVGSSDRKGAYPATAPQSPENMAATIYDALGIPKSAHWNDAQDRPNAIYHGEPISGLTV